MASNFPNAINGSILMTIQNGDISTNTITDTVQGFLLSGSLTTDGGIGNNVGVTGANIIGNPYTGTNGTYTNLPTTTLGGGTGMTVNVTIAASTVTAITIVNGGSGYSIGDFVTIQNSELIAQGADPGVTVGNLDSDSLTAADLTGGGTPYMLNFNPSPVSSSFGVVPQNQRLLIGGPQLALYHAYNTTVSQSLYGNNLPQTSNNTLGAGTLLWTTSGSDPANSNNYMTWAPDGSDAQSYQDTNIPFKIERGDVIRVEGIKNIANADTNSSSSINIEEDFVVERVIPYYYSSSFSDGQQFQQSLDGVISRNVPQTNPAFDFPTQNTDIGVLPLGITGDFGTPNVNLTWTGYIGGALPANGNPGRAGELGVPSGGSGYVVGDIYSTTVTPAGGTGATIKVLSFSSGTTPGAVQIINPGQGYAANDVLRLNFPLSGGGCTVTMLSPLDRFNSIQRNSSQLNNTGGYIEVISSDENPRTTGGWLKITLSNVDINGNQGHGFLPGDLIIIGGSGMDEAAAWSDPTSVFLPSGTGPSDNIVIKLTDELIGNQTFNNDFTVKVDVNADVEGTSGASVPSGSQPGVHLYEKGEVALTADTFIQVTPDPNVTLNGLLLGEVKKFTVRRQIEADDKVMLKNIPPPSGSKGIETPSGQGFLIPNDFSEVQKSNALNIINQLKAKNAFNKPVEPGITDGGSSIIVQGSGSDTIINIP